MACLSNLKSVLFLTKDSNNTWHEKFVVFVKDCTFFVAGDGLSLTRKKCKLLNKAAQP